MIKKWKAKIVSGRVVVTDRDLFNNYISTLPEDVVVTVNKVSGQRSINQCRYYFGVIIRLLSDHLGLSPEETHSMIGMKFLSHEFEVMGEKYLHIRSSTDLSTKSFEEYLSTVRAWASAELKLFLPLPNEVEIY